MLDIQAAFEDKDTNSRDLHRACELLLQRELELPSLYRLRLIGYTDPSDLPEVNIRSIIDSMWHAEASMRYYIEGRFEDMPLPIPTPPPTPPPRNERRIRWSASVKARHNRRKQEEAAEQAHLSGRNAHENEWPEMPHENSRSKTRKAQRALSNGWKRFSKELREVFEVFKTPTPTEPVFDGSTAAPADREGFYLQGSQASTGALISSDQIAPMAVVSPVQQPIDGTADEDEIAQVESPVSRWSSSSEDNEEDDGATRFDSATTNFLRRASTTLGLKQLRKAFRSSRS